MHGYDSGAIAAEPDYDGDVMGLRATGKDLSGRLSSCGRRELINALT